MIKKITFVFYVVLIVVMAAATIIEHLNSTPFVSQYIYGAWWFSLLWALLVAVGVVYIAKSHLRKWNLLLLHLSMIVILVGAFLTHTTGFKGMIHLGVTSQLTSIQRWFPCQNRAHIDCLFQFVWTISTYNITTEHKLLRII